MSTPNRPNEHGTPINNAGKQYYAIKDGKFWQFRVTIAEQDEYRITFNVEEIVSHGISYLNDPFRIDGPCEFEQYIHASIKWDGCSHVHYGNEFEPKPGTTKYNGYHHLCGAGEWIKHIMLMKLLWDYAREHLYSFDIENAGGDDLYHCEILNQGVPPMLPTMTEVSSEQKAELAELKKRTGRSV